MTRTTHQLWHFHGGLKLPGEKHQSTGTPIARTELPRQLVIPVHQHIGETGKVLVNIGDRVLKGQALTQPTAYVSAPVHAPTSGTVKDIAEYPAPHPSRLSTLCVVIEADGKDEWIQLESRADYKKMSPADLRNLVRHAGIVGLGGAAFPTSVKLNPGPGHQIKTLIINGAECEPYITCDDMLMRERADEVISGAEIISHALNTAHCLIAVENNKPEAIAALNTAISDAGVDYIDVVAIPTIYPTGGEKQLIKVLTNKEVPSDGLPADIGIVMQNVGTAAAIYRAVFHGQPLISRIVTVTGKGITQPQNMEVLIGTPMSALIEQACGYQENADRLIMGGPMMGFTMHCDSLPVTKGCNCLLVETADQHSDENNAMPCIRCGECARVCPVSLLPQQLYWHASSKNFDQVQDYNLFDCIECGCCAYVCPSHIPLVQYYRFAKTEIWNRERDQQKSDHARIRHDFRQARLDKEKREREERLRKKKDMLEKKKQAEAADKNETEEDPKKAAIAAALARVQDKKAKAADAPKNTDNLTAAQQKQVDEANKRRETE
ncbi:MAG: electron transport complex subunit RsxC [Gammaproteobacteria bacterium]|nr:electron transport complex subunit RsxC [Gammaproteobacteria bacterium]